MVLSAPTLAAGGFTTNLAGIASGGAQTTATVTMPAGNAGFLRIQQQ